VVIDDADDDGLAGPVGLVALGALPVAQCPGRSNFGTSKASMCNNAPASVHS
jgi:hypothetical protein